MVKAASLAAVQPCRQVAALPWRREADGLVSVMLITSRTNGKWMLPKGWPMKGRTEADAARQEAREEAGIEGVVAPDPIGAYRYTKLLPNGTSLPGEAAIYALAVTSERPKWKEKGQRQRKWVPVALAPSLVYELDLARFLGDLALGVVVLPDTAKYRSSVA